MNTLQFTQEEYASFTQALRYGRAYVATLNEYQKSRLADLARENQYEAIQVHTTRFETRPYAPKEQGQLDYWLDNAPAYVEGQQILALLAEVAAPVTTAATTKPQGIEAPKLSLRQIALLYIYTRQQIPNSEADAIAQAHGHSSGQKLYKLYNKYLPTIARTNVSGREIKPLIKDVQAVLTQLSGQQKKCAEDELQTLESKIIDRF